MAVELIVIGIVIGFIIAYFLLSGKLSSEENNRKRLSGKYAEKLIPLSNEFKYELADTYCLGMPIDYIVFDGLNEGNVRKVIFLEVKTGKSAISKRENLVKEAIKDKRIGWEEVRI